MQSKTNAMPIDDPKHDLNLLGETLSLCAHILVRNPDQLGCQLHGRLPPGQSPAVQRTLAGARCKTGVWLRPHSATLESIYGARYRTLVGHSAAVRSLAVTPDSRKGLSAAEDGTVRVWDIKRGLEEACFTLSTTVPSAVLVTPDAKQVLVGCSDGAILVWAWPFARLMARLEGHTGAVLTLRSSSTSRLVVSGSADGTLRVWDLTQFTPRFTMTGHQSAVVAVVITPDGNKAASTSRDKTVRIWSLENGTELAKMESPWEQYALDITPDGQSLISGSEMVPIVWDLNSGAQSAILTDFNGPLHTGAVAGVAISPDGRLVVTASDDLIRVWNLKDQYPLHGESVPTWYANQSSITKVAVSPNGNWALSAARDGVINVWNLVDPLNPDRVPSIPQGDPVKWIGFGPRQQIIQLSSAYTRGEFGEDSEWRSTLQVGEAQFDWYGQARDLAQSADRSTLVLAVENGLEVFDTDRESKVAGGPFGIWSKVALSPDAQYALCYSWRASKLQAWNLAAGITAVLDPDTRQVQSITFTGDNCWVGVGFSNGVIKVWRLSDFAQVYNLNAHAGRVNLLVPDPSGRMISCGEDGLVHVWDLEHGFIEQTFKLPWEKSHSLLVRGDGKSMAVISDQGAAMVWDLGTGNPRFSLKDGSVKRKGVWETDLSGLPLGNLALFNHLPWLAAGDGKTLHVWDYETGVLRAAFTGDSEFETISVSPDDAAILIGTVSGGLHHLVIEGLALPGVGKLP